MIMKLIFIAITILALWLSWYWLVNLDEEVSLKDTDIKCVKPDYEKMFDRIYDGLKWVESTNDPTAVGDDGNSIGILQIGKDYFEDAAKEDVSIYPVPTRTWKDQMHNPIWAKAAMKAYMKRYGRKFHEETGEYFSEEDFVRIHNGGPNGINTDSTLEYLEKYKYYRNMLDQGIEPIKGTSRVIVISKSNVFDLPIGTVVDAYGKI